jgi:hypothetical protein
MYKPLSNPRHRHLGSDVKSVTDAQDEVADLPGSLFFSGRVQDAESGDPPGLFYKDQTEKIRRVLLTKTGGFRFSAVLEPEEFEALGEVLFVPEVDPRAWSSARDAARQTPEEFGRLKPGDVFTALGSTEDLSSHLRGVYQLGPAGEIRRLLRGNARGLEWSDRIPRDRFGNFGAVLAVLE